MKTNVVDLTTVNNVIDMALKDLGVGTDEVHGRFICLEPMHKGGLPEPECLVDWDEHYMIVIEACGDWRRIRCYADLVYSEPPNKVLNTYVVHYLVFGGIASVVLVPVKQEGRNNE